MSSICVAGISLRHCYVPVAVCTQGTQYATDDYFNVRLTLSSSRKYQEDLISIENNFLNKNETKKLSPVYVIQSQVQDLLKCLDVFINQNK